MIELTNFCNLNCSMCPRGLMKRKVGFMDFGLFKNIIYQCKDYTDFIWLHAFGEPTFHPQLEQCINFCSHNNIESGISTNATILTKEKALTILNSKLDLIILSLDAATKETYQRIRVKGDFDQVRTNIKNFLELKKKLNKRKLRALVQMLVMEATKDEIEVFKKEWENLADFVYIKNFFTWGNQEEIAPKMKECLPSCNSIIRERYPCVYFWRDGVILWNGDFVPCCADFDGKMVLGNLHRDKLIDIWNSATLREVRREQIADNYNNPLCKNCTEWEGYKKDIFYPLSALCRKLIVHHKNVIKIPSQNNRRR